MGTSVLITPILSAPTWSLSQHPVKPAFPGHLSQFMCLSVNCLQVPHPLPGLAAFFSLPIPARPHALPRDSFQRLFSVTHCALWKSHNYCLLCILVCFHCRLPRVFNQTSPAWLSGCFLWPVTEESTTPHFRVYAFLLLP